MTTLIQKILTDLTPMTLATEHAFTDELLGLDGTLIIPSDMEFKSLYIANMLDMLQKTRIAPEYVNGVYKGFDCLDYNIPSGKTLRGIYMIQYLHPITGERSIYIGTTIQDPRDRIGKFVRIVSTGKVPSGKNRAGKRWSESGAAALKWVERHGMTLDYATAIFIPLDMTQKQLRDKKDGVEGHVIRYLRKLYPDSVLNVQDNTTLTLEKKIPTPALDGLDI